MFLREIPKNKFKQKTAFQFNRGITSSISLKSSAGYGSNNDNAFKKVLEKQEIPYFEGNTNVKQSQSVSNAKHDIEVRKAIPNQITLELQKKVEIKTEEKKVPSVKIQYSREETVALQDFPALKISDIVENPQDQYSG